jgi:oligosaccharyltransferase complex subunit beta
VQEYEIVIEELAGGAWRGYAGHDDVQLRYTRMDPFVITRLTPGPDGKYSTRFILPDVYGLFTFKVNYHKTGYSNIDAELVEVIRPLRTTHHERFLFGAYPYYVSAFSMMVGVFAVSFVFLYHRDQTKAKAE